MKEKETRLIARAIGRMLQISVDDEGYSRLVAVLRKEIRQVCKQFPLYA
jgi:glycine/serine hydroxymethyltransferase